MRTGVRIGVVLVVSMLASVPAWSNGGNLIKIVARGGRVTQCTVSAPSHTAKLVAALEEAGVVARGARVAVALPAATQTTAGVASVLQGTVSAQPTAVLAEIGRAASEQTHATRAISVPSEHVARVDGSTVYLKPGTESATQYGTAIPSTLIESYGPNWIIEYTAARAEGGLEFAEPVAATAADVALKNGLQQSGQIWLHVSQVTEIAESTTLPAGAKVKVVFVIDGVRHRAYLPAIQVQGNWITGTPSRFVFGLADNGARVFPKQAMRAVARDLNDTTYVLSNGRQISARAYSVSGEDLHHVLGPP